MSYAAGFETRTDRDFLDEAGTWRPAALSWRLLRWSTTSDTPNDGCWYPRRTAIIKTKRWTGPIIGIHAFL
jgi:hypothetical protein